MTENAEELASQLSDTERRILAAFRDTAGPLSLQDLAEAAGLESENAAYSAVSWLQKKGLADVSEQTSRMFTITPEGERYAREDLPEWQVYREAAQRVGGVSLNELNTRLGESVVRIALAWWKRSGLGSIETRGNETYLVAAPKPPTTSSSAALKGIVEQWRASGKKSMPVPPDLKDLLSRPGIAQFQDVKHRTVRPTPEGRRAISGLSVAGAAIGEVTPELLRSGAWKEGRFQAYSVTTAAPRVAGAKPHPLSQIIDEVRQIFVELGFTEIDEEYVQSAFWNMDALFIPQDHPAREMQDTFYLTNPAKMPVEPELIQRIGKVHKTGGDTGSRGWGQDLDPEESQRALLRTHTTVGTIRYLAKHPEPPVRVFSVGRVFRHETMDATHLPEFHQIEGICTEEGADFPMLLGILQEFYRRLGFPTLRWRPAFFPYTEPSMEVEVWTGGRWMELGGCGIFRPEVTRPFGVKTPVLAWGLGLERLAMMRLKRADIRDLYVSDLEWLRNQPLVD